MKRLASAITVALLAFSMTVSYAETVSPTKIEGIWTNRDNEVCDINVIDPGNQQDPVLAPLSTTLKSLAELSTDLTTAVGVNLITNGDFENGKTGWGTGYGKADVVDDIEVPTKKCLNLTNGQVNQIISVEPGKHIH